MKKHCRILRHIPVYIFAFLAMILITLFVNSSTTVISEKFEQKNKVCVIIDPGHGGIDGGAISCSGTRESVINLQIAERANDLFHFLGFHTIMTRDTDRSIHTEGTSISQKKISDLKQRVKIVNEQDNAILISIHQNHFGDSRYYGPQVFYGKSADSKTLAIGLQKALNNKLGTKTDRKTMAATGVYLMEHIACTGILVECGFLSNPEEDKRLSSTLYQKRLSCVIATVCANYLNQTVLS